VARTFSLMDIEELMAREQIRDLVARYNSTADSGRFDETVELFAPDAVMEVGDAVLEGREAIREMFAATKESLAGHAAAGPRYVRHLTATQQIDVVSPTEARSRCYFQVLLPHGLDHWGRYLDTLGLVEGRWRFTHRRVITDGNVEGGWSASRR
jgi:uncharacterized protein (TIGR02246 family)